MCQYIKINNLGYLSREIQKQNRNCSNDFRSSQWRSNKDKNHVQAFLSYAQLREYLSVLIENNLLEYLEGSQTYKTTEKGLNFLKMHNEIDELLQTSSKQGK